MASIDSPRSEVSNRLESYINWHILPRWKQLRRDRASNKICSLFLQTVPPVVLKQALPKDHLGKRPVEIIAQMRENLIKRGSEANVAIEPSEPLFSILRKIVSPTDLAANTEDQRVPLDGSLHAIKVHLENVLPRFFMKLEEWKEEQGLEDRLNILRKETGEALILKEPPQLKDQDLFLCNLFLDRASDLGIEDFVPQNPEWSPAEKVHWMFNQIRRSCQFVGIQYDEKYSISSLVQEMETRNCIRLFKAIAAQNPHLGLVLTGDREKDAQAINQWIQENEESKALEVEKLDLSDANMSYLPEQMNLFRNLKELTLKDDRIGFFPSHLDLPHLKELTAINLPMEFWPDDETIFPELETLALIHSPLKSWPSNPEVLPNLKVLNLGGTQLKKWPSELGLHPKLEYLFLTDTQIEELPDAFPDLKYLDIRGTRIQLPQSLLSRPNLRIESLSDSDREAIRDATRYLTQPGVLTRILNQRP